MPRRNRQRMGTACRECCLERPPDLVHIRWAAFEEEHEVHEVLAAGVQEAGPGVRAGVELFGELLGLWDGKRGTIAAALVQAGNLAGAVEAAHSLERFGDREEVFEPLILALALDADLGSRMTNDHLRDARTEPRGSDPDRHPRVKYPDGPNRARLTPVY